VAGHESAGDGPLALTVHQGRSAHVLTLAGEADISTTRVLREALDELIASGATRVVVDLRGLSFMDSSGLGALVRAQRRLRVVRGSLALVCGEGPVLRLLGLTGLRHVFRVFDSVEAAAGGREG
jgi:anti-anti-sigma factor